MGSQSTITAVSKSWSSISSQSSSIRSDWSISYYRNDSDQDSVESISSTLMIALLRESLFTSRYRDKQNEGLLKTNWKVNELFLSPRCLKITEKVSFNIASEASYVYILIGISSNFCQIRIKLSGNTV